MTNEQRQMSSQNNIFGSEFQILRTQTAKKYCLQLTLESVKNSWNEWPRVLELQTNVKKLSGDNKTTSCSLEVVAVVFHI